MREERRRAGWYLLACTAAFAAGLLLCRFVPVQEAEEMGVLPRQEVHFVWRDAAGCLMRSALRAALLILSTRNRLGRISCNLVHLRLCVQAGFVFALLAACGTEGIICLFLARMICDAVTVAKGFSGDIAGAWLWLCLYGIGETLLLILRLFSA